MSRSAPTTTTTALDYDSATTSGIIRNKELIELSGVVSGGVNKDILWVHNDRGNLPRLYALNKKGETVGTYSLDTFNDSGTMAGDWEDIARMPSTKKGSEAICFALDNSKLFTVYDKKKGDRPLHVYREK